MTGLDQLRNHLYSLLKAEDTVNNAIELLAEHFKAKSGFFNLVSGPLNGPLFHDVISYNFDIEAARRAEIEIGVPDPWSAAYLHKYGESFGKICLGSELCSPNELRQSPWSVLLSEHQICDVLITTFTVRVAGASDEYRAVFTLHRDAVFFSADDRDEMLALLDDIRFLASIAYSRRQAFLRSDLLEHVMHMSNDAMVLLSERGEILLANEGAKRMLLLQPVGNGGAVWRTSSLKTAIDRWIAEVREEPVSRAYDFDFGSGQRVVLRITVVNSTQTKSLDNQTMHVIITARSVTTQLAISSISAAQAFGLSHAESEIACLIYQGKSTEQIARIRTVSVQTIRSQIKSIFAKMHVQSRIQLARRLSVLADVGSNNSA